MSYTDYKTGKPISREQYIINGIERGELLVKQDCGCVVIQDRTAGAYIVYCLKHEAAPDMYEALKIIQLGLQGAVDCDPAYWTKVQEAIAKAEGKGG